MDMNDLEKESAEEPKQNVLGLVSAILGIAASVMGFCLVSALGSSWLLMLGIPAMLIGCIAFVQTKRRREVGQGVALAGTVLGAIALLLWILGPIVGNLFRTV